MQLKEIGTIISDIKIGEDVTESFEKLACWQKKVITTTTGFTTTSTAATAAEVAEGTAAVGAAAGTTTLSAAIKGLVASVSSFVVTIAPVVPFILAAGYAFKKAYDAAHAYENAVNAVSEAQSQYQETASELDSVNSELETTNARIEELQSKGTLTLTEQAELDQLQSQNAELERQASLLERVSTMQQRAATNAAMDALNTVGSQSKYSKEHAAELDGAVGYTTELDAAKEDLKYLKQLYAERETLQRELENASTSGNLRKYNDLSNQLKDKDKEISEWTSSLGNQVLQFQEYKNILEQDTNLGKTSGGQEMLSDLTKFINDFANVGTKLTPVQDALSKIQSFFNGSSGKNAISESILDMVKNGNSAEEAINKLGLSLKDLGLEGSQVEYLNQYFNDLANSANNAASAVDEIDSSLSGIGAASESTNAGDAFDKYISYIDNARRYYAQGKTGLDDFKTVASSLNNGSQDVADNLDQFKTNLDKISKYLTVDTDSKLTQSSSTSNIDGTIKSSITLDDGQLTVTKQNMLDLASAFEEARKSAESTGTEFKSTADLAEALDIPIDFLEYSLGKMQDYDIYTAFDDLPKASQSLVEAKTQLASLQDLYNNMDAGSQKDALGEKIANWKTQISAAEDDIKTLDTDIVLQMKLEYDIASLQAQIDDAKTKATLSGDSTEWATSISYQMQLVNQLAESGITIPVELRTEAEDLMTQLQEAVSSGNMDLARELYPKVSAAWQEVINSMESSAGFDIAVDADTSEANKKMDESEKKAEKLDGTTSVVGIDAEDSTTDTVNDIIASLTGFDKDYVATLTAKDNASQYLISILAQLTQIPEQELININANDGASGIIAYLQNNLNELPEEVKTKLTAQDATSEKAKKAASEVDKVPKKKNTTLSASGNAVEQAKAATNAINNIPKSKTSTITIVTNKLTNVVNTVRNVVSNISDNVTPKKAKKFNGTAHAQGTVRVSGNWGIAKDEDALVNELGNEIILRDGKPFTVNNGYPAITKLKRGDIIFNHEQTKELLEKGYVTGSHAKVVGSFAGGSLPKVAYASGTSSSSKNEIDWFEILLDRAEAILKKYTTKLENSFDTLSNRLKAANDAAYAAKQEYSKQQSAYNGYLAAASKIKLSDSLKKKIQSGANYIYDGYTDSEKELIDKYKELWEKAQDAAQAMEELKETIADLYKQAFDIVNERYNNEFDALSKYENIISNNIDLAEAKGYSANKTDYESLIQYMEREISKGKSEYADLTSKLDTAVKSGYVKKFSDEWWQMYNEILDVAGAIQEAEVSIAEYQQAINELEWDNFDYIEDRISQITQETDFLIGLLEGKDLFDDNGNLTTNGAATITLHNTAYDTYMKQAKDYADAIEELNQQIAADPSNQNLIERREDLLKLQQDSIESALDEKDAIKDLIQDGNDALVESMNDRIEAYEDALDAAKDLYDYQKKVADSTKNIASLEKQLAAYQGDNSEEARAKIQSIKVQLEEAQADLEETQIEHQISEQKKMLSQMSEDFEDALNARMDNIDAYLSELLASVEDGGAIPAAIKSAAGEVGYTISDSLSEMIRFGDVTDVLNDISDNLNELLTNYEPIALNSNNDPIIRSDGTVQKVNKPVVKSKHVGGYTSGGFVSDIKKAIIANGDDMITVNTLKAGEAILTPEQTEYFKAFVAKLPQLYDLSQADIKDLISGDNVSQNIDYNVDFGGITIAIDKVEDYNDFVTKMQNDNKFEKMVQAMTIGKLNGGGNFGKYNVRWN